MTNAFGVRFSMVVCVALVACGDPQVAPDGAAPADAHVGVDASTIDASTIDASTDVDAHVDVDASTAADAGHDASAPLTRCACRSGNTCLQGNEASSCTTIAATCTSGTIVDACDPTEAQASCARSASTIYYAWARTDGRLETARASCSGGIGTAGVFTVATIPAGIGDDCSCQRTAASCAQTYGTRCATLACTDPGVRSEDACTTTGRIAGRCVTRDGQVELSFYPPATLANAESSCHAASATELYWFPAGT